MKCGIFSALIFMLVVLGHAVEEWSSFCSAGEPKVEDNSETGRGTITHSLSPTAKSWWIRVNRNYSGIDIRLRDFVLEDHFLVIKEAVTYPPAGSGGTVQFVSGQSVEPLKFKIPFGMSFYLEICPEKYTNEMERKLAKFILEYTRNDPKYDDEPIPDDGPDIEKKKESYEIQFKGQPPSMFALPEFTQKFKEVVKLIAEDYCLAKDMPFNSGKPASEMVSIYAIHECPIEWSDRHICTSVLHSVSVRDQFDTARLDTSKYILTANHLKDMWSQYNSTRLNCLNMTVYHLPEKEEVIGWWFLIIVLPVVIIISTVFFLWRLYKYVSHDWDHNTAEVTMSTTARKRKKSKLKPNEYQTMPSFIINQKEEKDLEGRRKRDSSDSPPEERNYYAALLLPRFRLPEETAPQNS